MSVYVVGYWKMNTEGKFVGLDFGDPFTIRLSIRILLLPLNYLFIYKLILLIILILMYQCNSLNILLSIYNLILFACELVLTHL